MVVNNAATRHDPSLASHLQTLLPGFMGVDYQAESTASGNWAQVSVVEDKYHDPTPPLHPGEEYFCWFLLLIIFKGFLLAPFWSLASISNPLLSTVWHHYWASSPSLGSESNLYCPFGEIWHWNAYRTIHNHNVQIKQTHKMHSLFIQGNQGLERVFECTGKPQDTPPVSHHQTKTDRDEQYSHICPTHLHVFGLWSGNTWRKPGWQRELLSLLRDPFTVEIERPQTWKHGDLLQLSRSAAFGNWANLKGIVLNLHHSA